MILLDANLHELGEVDIDLDVEVGTSEDASNDFVMSNATFSKVSGVGGFYIPNTELGGMFEDIVTKTDEEVAQLRGYTWRGLMSLSIIEPPSGSDYMTVSGEANDIITSLLANVLGGFFNVSTEDSGLTITSYQFPLYINTLDGIEGMLERYGYRLHIWAEKVASGQPIQVKVEAVQATQLSGTYDEDNKIPMTFELNKMGINHLICVGSGELQNRMKVDLYIDEDGYISQSQFYTGFEERTAFFDYSSAESLQDLIDNGTEELKNLASSKTLEMKAPQDLGLEVGDVVKGVFPDGTVLISPVVKKIYTISNGLLDTEVKLKGEN